MHAILYAKNFCIVYHLLCSDSHSKLMLVAPVQTCRAQNDNIKFYFVLFEGHEELTFHCIANIVRSYLSIENKTSLHVAFYVNLYALFALCNKICDLPIISHG